MSEKIFFENIWLLTEQLKGAPIEDFEKKELKEAFHKADGDNFEKAKIAIANVLHGDTDYIDEKVNIYEDMAELLDVIRKEADFN